MFTQSSAADEHKDAELSTEVTMVAVRGDRREQHEAHVSRPRRLPTYLDCIDQLLDEALGLRFDSDVISFVAVVGKHRVSGLENRGSLS